MSPILKILNAISKADSDLRVFFSKTFQTTTTTKHILKNNAKTKIRGLNMVCLHT